MKKWIVRGTGLIFILMFFYFLLSCGKKPEPLKFVAVARGDIQEKALAVGTIEPEKEIKVKSNIPGIVSEVLFKAGDTVIEGKPLFKISPNPTPLEYVEASRNMEVAELALNKQQNDWKRLAELFKGNLISQSEMDAAESAYREAVLRHKIASERLELLEKGRIRMAHRDVDSLIKSPATGVILSQNVFQGDPVVPLTTYQPGTELCSLADMAGLLFKGTVDEIDVGKITAGLPADIQIGALPDARIEGLVERIFPKARKEGNATLFDIEITIIDTAGATLRAGYSATAGIRIRDRRGVLVLPERLVLFENDKKYAEIDRGENQVPEKVEIQTGLSDGLNVEILAGLKEGDRVVQRPPREIK